LNGSSRAEASPSQTPSRFGQRGMVANSEGLAVAPEMGKNATRRGGMRRIAVIALAAALIAGGGVAGAIAGPASSADAAELGPGYFPDNGLSPLGGFNNTVDGNISYCIDVGAEVPINNTTSDQGVVGQVNGLDPDMMSRLNFVLSKFGNTTDNNQAAAVAMVVWGMADPVDYAAEGGDIYVLGRAPSSEHAAIMAMVDSIRAEMGAFVPGSGGANVANLSLSVDPTNNYVGTLTVSLDPGSATGTVTLANGVFDSTGTNTADVTGASTTLAVHGVPPTEDGAPYKISASGTFEGTGGPGPNVHLYTTPGSQNITGAGTNQPTTFTGSTEDPSTRAVIFQPAATTQVTQKYLQKDDTLTDLVQPVTVADASGLNNSWYRSPNGKYVPITYTADIYCSLTEMPTQSAEPPAGVEVYAHASFTTSTQDGPTVAYAVDADKTAPGPGYCTWVWATDAAGQTTGAQKLIPAGYTWNDDYGQAVETTLVKPDVTTQATPDGLLGIDLSKDTANITGPVPAGSTIGFEAYYQAPGTDAICDADTLVFTSAPKPVTDNHPESDTVMFENAGTYFWIETLRDEDGDVLHQGECGAPGETTTITQLAVTTKAQATAVALGTAVDTAVMTGTIKPGDVLTFQAYKQGDGAAEQDQLVCDLSNNPITLTPGVVNGFEVTSAGCVFSEAGTYYWVETVTHQPTGEIVHRGKPRLPNETTIVTAVATTVTNLASTGAAAAPFLGLAGGLLLAGLLTAGLVLVAQRRRERVTATQQ
jgi:hypothetical protein